MRIFNIILSFVISVLLSSMTFADSKTVKLTSLDWPPYTGKSLANQGASAEVAKAAFAAMGYKLIVDFFPWQRAVNNAKDNPEYQGYFPEYYAESIEADFIFSDEMGKSPLGFVENKSKPVSWNNLNDLKGKKIGVVAGYVNEAKFDEAVANKELTAKEASDDATNIKKVNAGRLDLAVIDKNVLNYTLNTDLKDAKDNLQFNSNLLDDKGLFICFKKGKKGEELSKIFNEGLKKINVQEIMDNYFSKL